MTDPNCLWLSSPKTASLVFPTELYDRIIDFVASDASTLRTLQACALTCRVWLPRSRFYLFQNVRVTSFTGYDRLDKILRDNPTIAHLVRTLHFEIGVLGVSLVDYDRVLPVSLLARLPLLRSIKYYSALTAQTANLRKQIAELPRVHTVSTFSINVCVFQRLTDMIMLLATFPALKNLHLFEVFFVDREYKSCLADKRYSHKFLLTSLHMESLHEAPAIFGWLVETASTSVLNTLSIGLDRSEHLPELADFLRVCGDSITHLSFRSRSLVDNKYRTRFSLSDRSVC